MKPKKCKNCKELFQPTKPLQSVCGYACAMVIGKKATTKQLNQDMRHRKLALKTKAEWLRETQTVFNAYIRLRDAHLGCISCGNHLSNQYAAGHYRTVGSAPHLRFDERNVHKQCNRYCNMELSGNIIKYRQGLVAKIGLEAVEQLECDNTPQHYTIEQIQNIKSYYQLKIKELERLNHE